MNQKLKTIKSSKIETRIKLFFSIIAITFSTQSISQLTNFGIFPGGLVLDSYNPISTTQNYLSGSWDIDSILDSGTPVVLRLDATWCAPSWTYHQDNVLGDLYNSTGWNGTNEVAIFAIETDPFTADSLLEGGPNSHGNWVTDTPFPLTNYDFISDFIDVYLCPTVVVICPDRSIVEMGESTEAGLINSINNCNAPAPNTNDLRLVSNTSSHSSVSCNGSIMPIEIKMIVQNYSIIDINSYYSIEVIDNNGNTILGTNTNIALQPYEITEINLGLITPTLIGINNYTAFITTVNDDLLNDTLQFQIDVQLAEEMTIHDNQVNLVVSTDAYPEEFGMVFNQGIPVSNNLVNIYQDAIDDVFSPIEFISYGSIVTTNYNANINIPNNDGCYYFMFSDSSGQGINSLSSGNGVSISTNIGNQIWIDGNWDAGLLKQIKFIDVLSLPKKNSQEISLYPNPFSHHITIETNDQFNISIKSMEGKIIKEMQLISGQNIVYLEEVPAGIYFIEGYNTSTRFIEKIIVE